MLLPETSKRRARAIAERLRRALAAEQFEALTPAGRPSGVTFQVTMSVGVAAFPEDAQGAEALLGRADAAAYAAKRAGRNRVELFGLPGLVKGEAVPDARHRVDVARTLGVHFDLLAKPVDVGVDGAGLDVHLVAPDVAEQVGAAEHVARP